MEARPPWPWRSHRLEIIDTSMATRLGGEAEISVGHGGAAQIDDNGAQSMHECRGGREKMAKGGVTIG